MKKKEKIYKILIVGSGLSALSFVDGYLEKNKSIDIISPSFKKRNNEKVNHLRKLLPPQMMKSFSQVNNYFFYNKIDVSENCNFFGSLEFGGLSNYWGMQIDSDILSDIKHLEKSTKDSLSKSFVEIFKKYKLMGKVKFKEKIISNNFKKNEVYAKKFNTPNKNLEISEPILAFEGKNKRLNNLDKINEMSAKLTPKNLLKKISKKKKIKIHNFVVNKIKKHKEGLLLECNDGNQRKNFITKKLVLASGTVVTTKLILNYLKIFKEVKIKHHPRLFCLYFSKKNGRIK